jgi:hypothetical protein
VQYTSNATPDAIESATLLVDDQPVETVTGPLADTFFTWDTTNLGAGAFALAVQIRDVTGAEQTSEPVTVQVVFQGNNLPLFLLVLVALVILTVIVPLTLRQRRRLAPPEGAAVVVAGAAAATAGDETQAYLVADDGPTAGTRWLLAKSETVVGRSRSRADVVVTGRSASRQHARISRRGDVFIYVDLKADNYSLLNGLPLEGPHTLEEGDRITVGDTTLRFTRMA